VKSIITQNKQVNEIIIINDGSSDKTQFNIDKLKKKYFNFNIININQSNKGIGGARNSGVKIAKSDYLAFLDSDDVWYPTKIEECYNILNQDQNVDLLYHDEIKIINNKKIYLKYGKINKPFFLSLIFFGNKLSPSSIIVRKNILTNVGNFSENLDYNSAEDYDLWLKILYLNSCNIYYLNKFLGEYVITNNSITNKRYYHFKNSENVIKKHLRKVNLNKKHYINFELKRLFVFYIQETKINFKKFRFVNLIICFFKIFKILFKVNSLLFFKFLFKDKKLFISISGQLLK